MSLRSRIENVGEGILGIARAGIELWMVYVSTIAGIIRGTFAGRAPAIVQLGLLLLIATPVARVALSLVAFVLQRDRVYVIVTTIVLALLVFSLTGGVPG